MNTTPVILIFDIGKTNKKLLLFDEAYNMVYESIEQFQEINLGYGANPTVGAGDRFTQPG